MIGVEISYFRGLSEGRRPKTLGCAGGASSPMMGAEIAKVACLWRTWRGTHLPNQRHNPGRGACCPLDLHGGDDHHRSVIRHPVEIGDVTELVHAV